MSKQGVLQLVIHNCRSGNISQVRQSLDCKSADTRKQIIARKCSDGGTCLIVACRNGHLEIVEYLIDFCHADVEQTGSVIFDGEQVEGVSPLWCAAAAGHLNIVQFLTSRGAHVNRTTITNSTALRAACFDGHFEVVEYLVHNGADIEIPNRHGHTCLMISCYRGHCKIVEYLLERGARVNRQSAKGNTALHDCAESGNLSSLKLLLANGAVMKKDEYGLTPIMAGANSGYKQVVDFLASYEDNASPEEKAKAYELLGANMYDRQSSLPGAITAWKLAMNIRLTEFGYPKQPVPPPGMRVVPPVSSTDGVSLTLISDSDVEMVSDTGSLEGLCMPAGDTMSDTELDDSRLRECAESAFGQVSEFASPEELDALATSAHSDSLKLQTLLIRLRILGPDHPDTIYFIRYRGAIYADAGNISRCLALWMYALELQRLYLEPLCHVAQSAFLSFAELFIYILSDCYSALPASGLKAEVIVDCLELCIENIRRGREYTYYRWYQCQPWSYTSADKEATNLMRHVAICLHYVCMIQNFYLESTDPQRVLSEKTKFRFLRSVYDLVKLDPRVHRGFTLVHLACWPETSKLGRYPICSFPNAKVVKFLLDMGADPNVADAEGSRPVNMILGLRRSTEQRGDLIKILVENGAHLDSRGKRGRSALDPRSQKFLASNGLSWVKHTSLKCLCAQVIVNERIEVPPECLPKELADFLALH